jgi:hypothetical protein
MDPTLNLNPQASVQGNHLHTSGSALGGTIAAGSIDSDDFNRATGLGAGWTQIGGAAFSISADTLVSGSGNEWIQRAGLAVDYKDASTEFDLIPNPTGLTYTAAVTGVGADMLWTKVQSNSGGGVFDYIGFYHGVGAGGLGSYGGFVPITPVSGGHVRIYVTNAGDTMNVDIDEANDGTYEYHYESSGIIAAFGGTLGTGVGIGGYNAWADNWELGDGPDLTLTVTGACPGPVTFDVAGATPLSSVALVYGPAGAFTVPGGACAGLVLDIAAPTLAVVLPSDAAGDVSLSTTLPGAACGVTLQAIDLGGCLATNSVVL